MTSEISTFRCLTQCITQQVTRLDGRSRFNVLEMFDRRLQISSLRLCQFPFAPFLIRAYELECALTLTLFLGENTLRHWRRYNGSEFVTLECREVGTTALKLTMDFTKDWILIREGLRSGFDEEKNLIIPLNGKNLASIIFEAP